MQLYRCSALVVDRRVIVEPRIDDFLSGGSGLGQRDCWVALAPHAGVEVEVDLSDLAIIDAVAADTPCDRVELERRFDPVAIARLVDAGLLIGDHPAHASHRRRDSDLRRVAWWAPAAVTQVFSRWLNEDVEAEEARVGPRKVSALIAAHGLPPPEAPRRPSPDASVALPQARKSALDSLLAQRTTCRNFSEAPVSLQALSDIMHRVFGAQARKVVAPGMVALKKNSPSGGGLHPIDAFLLVRNVEGLPSGTYHYHCTSHSLDRLAPMSAPEARKMAHALVAGQPWFAAAPVLVVMAARFERNFWKYRHHPKAWKVVQLDAGHLSQNLYLSATELGYGAFVTGAINDAVAEAMFALDGLVEAPVVVGGFGVRGPDARYLEFDPQGLAVR